MLPKAAIYKVAPYGVGVSNVMETLEFIIYPDGRVQEKVTGIVGSSCAEVTAAIEAQLGVVQQQQSTSEYFAQPIKVDTSVTNTAKDGSFSDW